MGLSGRWKAKLDGTSTSTPTKVGNRIYVGFYSGFTKGGVQCVVMDEDEDGNPVDVSESGDTNTPEAGH